MTDDPIADALASLTAPPLDARMAARIGARAKLELRAPPRETNVSWRFRYAVTRELVPALLALAAVVQVAGAARAVAKIYGKEVTMSSR